MATKNLSRHIDESSPDRIKGGLTDLSQRFDEIITSSDLAEIDRIALVSTLSQRILCANASKKEGRPDVGDDLLALIVEAKLKEVDIDKKVMPPKKIGIVSASGRKLPVLARCSDDMAFLWLFISATEEGLNTFALSFQAAENKLSDEFGNFRQRIFS